MKQIIFTLAVLLTIAPLLNGQQKNPENTTRRPGLFECRIQREGSTNVTTILGDFFDPHLPSDGRTDAVLIVDAFHEMDNPVLMLQNVSRTLNPLGRIGIIDQYFLIFGK